MKQLALIFFVISFGCQGQDPTSIPTTKASRFSFGLNASSDYCFRTMGVTDLSSVSPAVYILHNEIDRPKLGYTAGLSLRTDLRKHFEIESGLLYSNKGFGTKESDLTYGDLIDRRRNFVYNAAGVRSNGSFKYNFHYLDLACKINYIAGKKKIRFVFGAGFAINFLLKQTAIFKGKDAGGNPVSFKSHSNSYNFLNVSPCVSAGIDWKLTSRTSLRIEPSFRFGFIKIVDAPITAYLWSAGLNLSYSLKL